jgi:hypothetical protein
MASKNSEERKKGERNTLALLYIQSRKAIKQCTGRKEKKQQHVPRGALEPRTKVYPPNNKADRSAAAAAHKNKSPLLFFFFVFFPFSNATADRDFY